MAYSKRIFIILLFVLIFTHSFCFGATVVNPTESESETGKEHSWQYDNQYQNLYTIEYSRQARLISRIYSHMSDNYHQYKAVVQKVYDEMKTYGEHGKFMHVVEGTDNYYFDIFFGFSQDMTYDVRSITDTAQCFENVPCLVGTLYRVCQIQSAGIYYPGSGVNTSLPMAYADVVHPGWVQLFKDFGITPTSGTDETLINIQNAVQNTENTVNNINNSVNDVNNSINNDNVNVDTSTLPTDTTEDITTSGFDSIFETLYNTFTSGSAKDLVINIPFTNKSFTINTSNVYGNANLGLVKTLIQTFWYFVISYFIVNDIAKKINMIKSGNIEDIQKDNIKEDML